MPQLLHDPVAHWLVGAAAVAVVTGEIVDTTYATSTDRMLPHVW